MSSFWPSNLNLDDIASPAAILQSAKQEWNDRTGGVLTLVIQTTESTNKDAMLIVYAKHMPTNRTATLLSIVHRPKAPYPCKIQPNSEDLPDFLKKSYYQAGLSELAIGARAVSGGKKVNKWVCDTPVEFRSKLEEAFNLGTLKSTVLNLLSDVTQDEEIVDQEDPSQPAEESADTPES